MTIREEFNLVHDQSAFYLYIGTLRNSLKVQLTGNAINQSYIGWIERDKVSFVRKKINMKLPLLEQGHTLPFDLGQWNPPPPA